MFMNGLSMSGIPLFHSGMITAEVSIAEDGIQIIRNEIDYGSYPAFTVKKGFPVEGL